MERSERERKRRKKKRNGENAEEAMGEIMKNTMSMIRAMISNVQGINCPYKRQEIEEYAEESAIALGLFSETQHAHSSEEGGRRR